MASRSETQDKGGATARTSASGGRLTALLGLCLVLAAPSCNKQRPLVVAADEVVAATGLAERLFELVGSSEIGPVTVAAGTTGEALLLAQRGAADLLLVSSEAEVRRLAEQGRVQASRVLFHNEYVIVGRKEDPALLHGGSDGALALRAVNRSGASFIVPQLGTEARFKLDALWKLQTDKRASPSFLTVDGGAREAVLAAHRQGAYTLVDRATRLTYLEARGLRPQVLLRGGSEMVNAYHLVLLKPPPGEVDLQRRRRARALYEATAEPQVAELISSYGVTRYAEPLFDPGAPKGAPPRMHRQLPHAGAGAAPAPLRPGLSKMPNPHGAGGLPLRAPHGPMMRLPAQAAPPQDGAQKRSSPGGSSPPRPGSTSK